MTKSITFTPITTRTHWELAAEFSCAAQPYSPVSADQMILWTSELPTDHYAHRWIAYEDDVPFGYCRIMKMIGVESERKVDTRLSLAYSPENAYRFESMLEQLVRQAQADGKNEMIYWHKDDNVAFEPILARAGFVAGQRNPECALILAKFDSSKFTNAIERAKQGPYEFMDLIEFEARYPSDWRRRYFDWENTVLHDVPLPEPFTGLDFDVYSKQLDDPTLTKGGCILAVRDGIVAASTQLNVNAIAKSVGNTGLTGTLREDRRRGLALALKVMAIEWARQQGVERIFADNEVNNPMRQINVALGFERVWDWVAMTKRWG